MVCSGRPGPRPMQAQVVLVNDFDIPTVYLIGGAGDDYRAKGGGLTGNLGIDIKGRIGGDNDP